MGKWDDACKYECSKKIYYRHASLLKVTFYRWKKKFGGLGVSELRRLKQVEEENRRLKRLVADLTLDKQMLQDGLSKKL